MYKPDLVIHVGDLFHEGFFSSTDDLTFSRYLQRAKYLFVDPFWSAVGNHDIGFPERVTEKGLSRFKQEYFLDKTMVSLKTTFQFINTIVINKTLEIVLDAICIVHYPTKELPLFLQKKLNACRKIYSGHVHDYTLYLDGKETNLPSFNSLQGNPSGFVISDLDQEKTCFSNTEKSLLTLLAIGNVVLTLLDCSSWDAPILLLLGVSLFLYSNALVVTTLYGTTLAIILPLLSKWRYLPQLVTSLGILLVFLDMGQLRNLPIMGWRDEFYCSTPCKEWVT